MNSVINQNNSSDIERLRSYIKLSPKEITYSQNSISPTICRGQGLIGASVSSWADEFPYNIPINIVKNNIGEYCSFGNRRLYAARNHAPPNFEIVAQSHDWMEILPEERKIIRKDFSKHQALIKGKREETSG